MFPDVRTLFPGAQTWSTGAQTWFPGAAPSFPTDVTALPLHGHAPPRRSGCTRAGVAEIRIRGQVEHRVIYIAKFQEAVYVLHAFSKKTQQTRQAHVDLARSRLREVEGLRRSTKEK